MSGVGWSNILCPSAGLLTTRCSEPLIVHPYMRVGIAFNRLYLFTNITIRLTISE
eukprot:COSAG01_NODE_3892_length_5578_cov_5.863296_9_plen_55_part_00